MTSLIISILSLLAVAYFAYRHVTSQRSHSPVGKAAEPEQPPQQTIPVPAPAATLKERVKKAKKSLGLLLWDSHKDGQCVLGKNAYKRSLRPRPRLPGAMPPPEPVCVSRWGNRFRHHRWKGAECRRCGETRKVRQSDMEAA